VQRSLIGSEYQPIRGRGQPFWVCGRDNRYYVSQAVLRGRSERPVRYKARCLKKQSCDFGDYLKQESQA
jgi:hypothetical protein